MQTRAWGLILDFVVAVIHLLFFGGTWHRSLLMWSIVTIPNEVLHFVLSSTSRPPGPTLVIRRLFRSESRNEIYRFQISGGGRVRAAGGTRGGIAWPPLIPIWRSSSLPPSLPLPASSASHVHVLPCQAPVCRYEIREKEIQGSMPAHKSLLWPHLPCPHPRLCLSPHPYLLSPHLSASISQTKLQTWSGAKWRQWWLQSDKQVHNSEVLKTKHTHSPLSCFSEPLNEKNNGLPLPRKNNLAAVRQAALSPAESDEKSRGWRGFVSQTQKNLSQPNNKLPGSELRERRGLRGKCVMFGSGRELPKQRSWVLISR